jgi:TPR repeat protein
MSDEVFKKVEDLYFLEKYSEAETLCRQHAKAGDIKCSRFMGWIYYTGKNCEIDLEKAKYWFDFAEKAGDPEAAFGNGAVLYAQENYTDAFKKFLKASDLGYTAASVRLGMMYKSGLGVSKNNDKAFELYSNASDKGNLVAARLYARMLMSGYNGFIARLQGLIKLIIVLFVSFKEAYRDAHSNRFMY